MNDNSYLSGVIRDQLEAHSPVVLASIVSMEGSSPRETGTKMIVAANGRSYGTIGGGVLEAAVVVRSKRVLQDVTSKLVAFDMDDSGGATEGMICGGKVEVLLDLIPPTEGNLELFEEMHDSIARGENLYFVTAFEGSGQTIDIIGHCLLFGDSTVSGDPILGGPGTRGMKEELHNISSTTVLRMGNRQFVIDPVRKLRTLYCFGAGHVAVPTARTAAMVGFNVVVIDDRAEFANQERFPDAHTRLIGDFEQAVEGLQIDGDSFVVIVTRGHRFDRVVLQQVINSSAAYIGMIGSRTKRDAIYRQLIAEGVATARDLERVHCPIGLSIGAETPEEIAISIVAELVQERGKLRP